MLILSKNLKQSFKKSEKIKNTKKIILKMEYGMERIEL